MTGAEKLYGKALYDLAREERVSKPVLEQMQVLDTCFRQEPEFLRLLSAPNLSKPERCRILDESFRGTIEPCLLNFLKLLTEKGYIRRFHACYDAYRELYHQDNGIVPVRAVSSVPLSGRQLSALTKKLRRITGKHIQLENIADPSVLGGIRLDYCGQRVDDTVAHRLDALHIRLVHAADSQKAGAQWK